MKTTRTMNLCKTCTNADQDGRGYVCNLTGKKCGVHPRYVDDDCVNYSKPLSPSDTHELKRNLKTYHHTITENIELRAKGHWR